MRLVTVELSGSAEAGVILGNDVLVFSKATRRIKSATLLSSNLRQILQAENGLDSVRRVLDALDTDRTVKDDLRASGALLPFADVKLMSPITDPALILSVGSNYHSHVREMREMVEKSGMKVEERIEPAAFTKSVSSLTGSGSPIILPRDYPDMVDFEGEFCVVMGRRCHNVSREDALNYVAGYTLVNDVSARNWAVANKQPHGEEVTALTASRRNIMGKMYPTFCPLGPSIVTRDAIPDLGSTLLTSHLNGTLMQSTTLDDLIFDIPYLVSFFSRWYEFVPGDIITTGSPPGVGFGRSPPVFMKPGDVIEVTCGPIGTLSNIVQALA